MEPLYSEQYQMFRQEVRGFLAGLLTPEIRAWTRRQAGVAAERDLGLWWHRKLYEKGWIAPAWPVEHGGAGWDVVQRHIFEEECAAAGAPLLFLGGLQLCGPVIMRFGTPEQKAFFLPRILSGEHYWAQGFSEPGAGSDLAALQTRAVMDGDHYVVNGSKIWTTHAHFANWLFMLVRTSAEGRPQAGITFLLTPLDAAGITIRPIRSMSGEHEVNQIFFDNLRVPVCNRVGQENGGWGIAKYLLEFERGGSYAALAQSMLLEAKEAALTRRDASGSSLWDDPFFRRRYADVEIRVMAQGWTEKRVVAGLAAGQRVGDTMASILKVRGSEVQQQASELAMYALGELALPDQREALEPGSRKAAIGGDVALRATAKYLNGRAMSIFGGSNEIQRNIIARSVISEAAGR